MNDELRRQLAEFRKTVIDGRAGGGPSSQNEIPSIQPQMINTNADAAFQEKLLKLSSIPLEKPPEAGVSFKGFRNIKTKIDTRHDWSETEPGEKAYCQLKIIDWDKENEVSDLLKMANNTFNSILTSFSTKAALRILQLTVNLRDRDNQMMFQEQNPDLLLLGGEVVEDQLSRVELFSGSSNGVEEIGKRDTLHEQQQLLTSYCFLAASLIRVITKSAENYTKISGHLKVNFRNFYKYDIKVTNFEPTVPALEALKDAFTSTDVMKHTLYTLLYSSEFVSTGKDVKKFLFQIHLQYTGLHAFVLFGKCVETYKVEPIKLAEALNTPIFKETLEALSLLFDLFVQEHEGVPEPKMWKYARIFDQSFFAELQTKHTIKFVAVLAYMIKAEGPTTTEGDVLKIARISQMPLEAKQRAHMHSIVVRRLLMIDGYTGPHAIIAQI